LRLSTNELLSSLGEANKEELDRAADAVEKSLQVSTQYRAVSANKVIKIKRNIRIVLYIL
jgi:hypothetical protein